MLSPVPNQIMSIISLFTFPARSQLMMQAVSSIPDGNRTYKAVGRMFLRSSLEELHSNYENKCKQKREQLEHLSKEKEKLQASIQCEEVNIRQMLSSRGIGI